jgi:hypothetical protein
VKTLEAKLARLRSHPSAEDAFILADAKDADMAFGLAAPGHDPLTGRPRSLADYRDQIREIVDQELVDIMLMSLSTSQRLTVEERRFERSRVTPAVRANDTSDIHLLSGTAYDAQPSVPFRTASVGEIRRTGGVELGLYSITPSGDAVIDVAALEAYRAFRAEAAGERFRHFLELFPPNVPGFAPADPGRFLNDFVARTLAGVSRAGRPVFLKLPWFGAEAMEQLAAYDPELIPGILGGAAGTTFDAFHLLEQARRHGARAALFGRKIKDSEHPLTFVSHLRLIADGGLDATEACRSYHAELRALGIEPRRTLEQDLQLTDERMAIR